MAVWLSKEGPALGLESRSKVKMQVFPCLEQTPEGKCLHLTLAGGSFLAPLLHQPLKSAQGAGGAWPCCAALPGGKGLQDSGLVRAMEGNDLQCQAGVLVPRASLSPALTSVLLSSLRILVILGTAF